MKKYLVFFFMLLLSMTVYAASYVAGGSIDEVSSGASQTVSLDLSSLDSFAFGFSGDINHTKNDNLAETGLKLSEDDNSIADNTSSPLYVWWDITTDNEFTVSISMNGHLGYTPEEGGSSYKIGWTVKGSDETSISGDVSAIDLTSEDTAVTDSFITVDADGKMHNFSGQQKLDIKTVTTDDLAIDGKPTGKYIATLTLKIANE